MLKDLFPKTSRRYLDLPILGPILDDLDDWLITRGYQPYTRRKHSRCMVGVEAYLQRQGRDGMEAVTPEDLQTCWQWYNQHRVHDASTVRVLHQYLDDQGRLPAPSPPPSPVLRNNKIYPSLNRIERDPHINEFRVSRPIRPGHSRAKRSQSVKDDRCDFKC